MKVKFEKYTEVYDQTLKEWVEKMYKDSYRRDWCISEIVLLPNNKKWLIKWERK